MELHVTKRKGREIVVLLDNDMRIVKPVYDYLKYQDQRDRAINTLIAYGNDLKAFWEFLSDYGYAYDEVSPKMIGEYKEYLMSEDDNIIAINKEGARTAKTINRMLSTLHGFYQYKADMQEIDNPLLMHEVNRPFNAFKGILEHARSDNKTKQSIFKVKESNYKINLVSDDEMELFLSRLDKRRDILLYKMLYLTGARIQEVLDLEIESVPVPDMSQPVGCFQQIKSKGKTRDLYVPMSLIQELDDFIFEERNLIDTDHSYIFVSEQARQLGKQLTYSAAYDKLKKVHVLGDLVEIFEDEDQIIVTKAKKEPENHNDAGININMTNSINNASDVAAGNGKKVVNKVAYCLLALFLGGFGAHKFYSGKTGMGILYIVFCWTAIPSFVAWVELIIAVFTKKADANGNIVM